MNIVFLSHSAFGGPFAVGSHHLADGLAREGHRVVHVVTPVSLLHVLRRRPGGNAEVRRAVGRRSSSPHGAVQLIPSALVPAGVVPPRLGRAAAAPLAARVHRLVGGPVDRVVLDQPLLVDLLDLVPAPTVVYRPTDRQTSGRLRRAEQRLVGRVDRVVTTGREVFDALPEPLRRLPQLELPNGVDTERFVPPAAGSARHGVVYVGALDERFDWHAVEQVGKALPDVAVDLYGPVSGSAPSLPDNVRLHGPVPVGDVPGLLQRARMALMPFNDDPRNTGRSPMKLWEYLASGLHVLANASPSLQRATPPGVHLYGPADSPASAAQALWPLTEHPNEVGVSAARHHSWAGNTRALLEFLR